MASDREYGRAYPVAKAIVKPIVDLLWRINTTGLHHVPESGPAIFCPNHISFFDSLVLPAVLPRRISYVGKAEYMDSWKTKYIFPAIGMIPIDRTGGSASQRALDTAARVLERGELFGIYPEGTRSRSGFLHRGRTGAARLALRTGAPLIPVGIVGTDEIQPAGASVPRPFTSCQVNIGAPIDVSGYTDDETNRLLYRQLTDQVMFEIRDLSGRDYVDVYAGSKIPDGSETAPVGGAGSARSSADVLDGGRHAQPNGAGVNGDREISLPDGATGRDLIEERASSVDVLARWYADA